jgi:hypothetical protein
MTRVNDESDEESGKDYNEAEKEKTEDETKVLTIEAVLSKTLKMRKVKCLQ